MPFSESESVTCSERVGLSLAEATSAHVSNEFASPLGGLAYAARRPLADALDTGRSSVRRYYAPRLRTDYVSSGEPPHLDYYRVEATTHGTATTTGYEYAVAIDIARGDVPDDATVRSVRELPENDRETLYSALGDTVFLDAPHVDSFAVVFAYERDETQAASEFVPGVDTGYLEWDGTLLALQFEGQRPVEISTTTVTVDLVAESKATFVEYVLGTDGVVLDAPTSEQRAILTEAIAAEYSECRPYSMAFEDLLDRLVEQDRPASLLEYDGTRYFVHLSR